MLPASLFPELAAQPLYIQLMYAVLAGSGLLCLAVVLPGALRVLRRRPFAAAALPPPPRFPYALDQAYTAFFMLFLLWNAAMGLEASGTSDISSGLSWGTILLGIAAQVGIYLPMLVRYALLHPCCRPTQPWWYYLLLPLLLWLFICLSLGILELSGLSAWLMQLTGCPEHQDVVLMFSRGDTMQRLYIAVCAVLVAPVAEECCFRGFLYTTLRRHGGCVAAGIASAFLFAAIHGSLAQLLPLTLFGIVQCLAYERARSLWLPIAVHALFNTTSLIATAFMQP